VLRERSLAAGLTRDGWHGSLFWRGYYRLSLSGSKDFVLIFKITTRVHFLAGYT
jgi:hypothetical protein